MKNSAGQIEPNEKRVLIRAGNKGFGCYSVMYHPGQTASIPMSAAKELVECGEATYVDVKKK